jgi:DNA invertase Pin-like site-specific DNA recombinase
VPWTAWKRPRCRWKCNWPTVCPVSLLSGSMRTAHIGADTMHKSTPADDETDGDAYSYVRFSTHKQELGDSLRRQVEMARAYCERHKLRLHEDSYRDLGVSAFRRDNLERGALAAFVEGVKTGKIPAGSYLVIEQFDRLSRADVDIVVRLLLELVHAGIKLVTLVDEKVWDRAAVKDIGNLILAIVWMSRANNESAMKSERLKHVWGAKKKAAADGTARRIITSECPRWLRPNGTKTAFEPIPERVESVQKVFDLLGKGMGAVHIARRANEEKWPAPSTSGTWHSSLINRLLNNRALMGEYQPYANDANGKREPAGEVVKEYYPAVLEEAVFMKAHAVRHRRGRFPGRRDASFKNWLGGMLKCGTCGRGMVRKNKNSAAQPEYARYYCSARNRGVTKCAGASAKEVEGAVLYIVSAVAPSYFEGSARMQELKAELDVVLVDLAGAQKVVDNYIEAIGNGSANIPQLAAKLREANDEVVRLEASQKVLRAELAELGEDFDSVFENIARQVSELNTLDARAQLREELARVLERVEVHEPAGYIVAHIRGETYPVTHPLRPDAAVPGFAEPFSADEERAAKKARRSP